MRAQALDAGSAAALPDGLRAELEQLEDHGGVRHLHDLAAQIKVCRTPFYFCHMLNSSAALNVRSTVVLDTALCVLMSLYILCGSVVCNGGAAHATALLYPVYSVGAEEKPASCNDAQMHN